MSKRCPQPHSCNRLELRVFLPRPLIIYPGDDNYCYWLRKKMIKSTNNELLKLIRKSIQFFVSFCQIHRSIWGKKYQYHVLPHLQKVFFSKLLFALENTSITYLHTLVKKTISQTKQMWQVWLESSVVIWLV